MSKRKITILGMGSTAIERRIDIKKYCDGTEIWGLNNGYLTFPHLKGEWDRVFELHNYEYLKDWQSGTKCHFTCLDELGCDVWTMERLPLIKRQVPYKIEEYCGYFKNNYFLGSPSLMLMLALYEHDNGEEIDEIRSWGIDTTDKAHGQQRQSWSWWLSKAHERKIKITGTACNFFSEHENDEGLRGLREHVGRALIKREKEELNGDN